MVHSSGRSRGDAGNDGSLVMENVMEDRPTAETFDGLTVEEAIAAGLNALGLDAEEAEVEILDRGSKGFLGIGARPARVAVSWNVRAEEAVRALTAELLKHMGIPAEIEVVQRGREVRVTLTAGKADGLIIGRKGETLHAIQHVFTRIVGRQFGAQAPEIILDIAGYRSRREEQLRRLAHTLAERVERNGRRAMTEPLPSSERRIVHRTLAEHPAVQTHTAGQGANKRVVLTPAGKAPSAP